MCEAGPAVHHRRPMSLRGRLVSGPLTFEYLDGLGHHLSVADSPNRLLSVSPACEVRLGHSLQLRPVQLPGGCERHFAEDDYFLGRLVADPRARELDQLLAGRALGPLRKVM
jgi:hypothetical protein